VYQLSKLEIFPPLPSVMFQDLALQRGASQLQTTSANLQTFSIRIISPLTGKFYFDNPADLRHFRAIYIFYCLGLNFSLILVTVLVLTLV
jgi:hypothetical protein